ncbi:MAG: integrase core domain-containing protein [Gammaproteobacteria bacterium]|nr:integrase core domain-containing protein [Gammaproteobacteria bacterium]
MERWHRNLKSECIRPGTPLNIKDAKRLLAGYVYDYNHRRLHSAIDYNAPADKLAGRAPGILIERERKLQAARKLRAERRQAQQQAVAR